MKQLAAFLFPFLVAASGLFAQAPTSFWTPGTDKIFNSTATGNPNDAGRTAIPIEKGGFLLVGLSNMNLSTGLGTIWAIKLDSSGKKIAEKTYPGAVSMFSIAAAVETPNGYVIVSAKTDEISNKHRRFMVSKTDLELIEGTEQLSAGAGSACVARLKSGLLLMGSPGTGGAFQGARLEVLNESDLTTVAVIDRQMPQLPEIWGKNLQLILPTPDGGCFLLGEDTGFSNEPGCNNVRSNVWVCRMDANLKPLWGRTYGGVSADLFTDAELRENGNLMVLGRTECRPASGVTGPNNIGPGSWVIELDQQGELLYAKSLAVLEPILNSDRVLGFGLLRGCPDALLVSGNYRLINGKMTGYMAKVRLGSGTSAIATFVTAGSGTWKREFTALSIYSPEDILALPFTRKIFAWGTAAAAVTGASADIWASVSNPDATPCAANPFSDAVTAICGETKPNQTTATGATDRGRHGNYLGAPNTAAVNYDGPDKTYKIAVATRSNLRITLDINAANNIDLDMFLFGSNPAGTPINGSIASSAENNKNAGDFKQEILERVVDPGTYYLVVDGRAATDKGLFSLKFECGCATCNCAEAVNDLPSGRKLLTDNFEQYKIGNLAPQSTRWTPDPTSVNTALPQVIRLTAETQTLQMSGARKSVFYDLAPLPNNRYRLSFQLFVTANKTANYTLFKEITPDNAENYGVQVMFNADGSGNLKSGNSNSNFKYAPGKWMTLTHLFDLGQDSVECWIEQQFIGKWKFNDNTGNDPNDPTDDDQATFYIPRLLFRSDATADYRVDNLCLWEKMPCAVAPVPTTCLVSPGSGFYTSAAAANCDLYTGKEVKECRSVCETNATVFHREPVFQGIVGPAAPPSLALLSDCIKSFYANQNTPFPKYADLVLFYNESSKNIEVNLNAGGNTDAFVFQCVCEDGLNGILQVSDDVVTANGCEQLCLGRVNDDYSNDSPRPRGYYYLLIMSDLPKGYSLNIIPEGPCGKPITNLNCGTPISDNLNTELNTFKKNDNAYRVYNGPRAYDGRDKIYAFTLSRPQYIDLSLTANTGMGMFLFTDQCGENPILYRELPDAGGTVVLDSFFLPPAQYYLSIDEYEPNKGGNYVLRLDQCTDAPVSELLNQLAIQSDPNCPTDNAQKHTVSLQTPDQLAQPATVNLNDLVHFKFKDHNNLDRTSTFLFWNGTGLNFPLPADAGGNNPKCGYLPGDPLRLAIQHYDNASSEYVDYAIGLFGPSVFQPGGNSSVTGLTPVKTVFFHVNPQILNPSNLGKTYTVRVTSSGFNWKIDEAPGDFPWIKIPLPTGSNNQQRNIEFEPNPGPGPREARLIVRSTDAGSVQYTDTILVVQAGDCSAKPTYAIETPATALCAGQSVTLTAKLPAGANPAFYAYQWSSGKTGQTATEILPDLAASSTTYTVTVFDRACGSAGTATKTIAINASEWRLLNTPVQSHITDDRAGTSVAFAGEWAAVGAPQFDDGAAKPNVGRVLLYRRTIVGSQETWALHKELKASDGTSNHQFGYRVSLHGNFMLVGAPGGDGNTPTKPGAAYLFSKDQGGANQWGEIKKIAQATVPPNNNFGAAVSLHGDYAFVGADVANAVFVYHRNQGGPNQWGLVKTLTGAAASRFGSSLATEGNLVVVGAKNHNAAAIANAGTAIVFQRNPTAVDVHSWVSVDTIIPPTLDNLKTGDQFGHSVAIQGDYLLIGAPKHDNNNGDASFDNGAAWLYERDPAFVNQWKKRRKITGGSTKADNYGSHVTLAERYAVVGAELEGNADNGAIYLYHRNKNGNNLWGLVRKLTAPTAVANPSFGFGSSAAISAQNLLVGAALYDTTIANVANANRGRAYFFKLACLTGAPPGESALESVAVEGIALSGLSLNCSPIPFRDELTITVTASAPLEAQVQICDVAGRVIETLHDGYLQEENTYLWAAETAQAGMYYVVVRSAAGKMVKPVVLMR